MTSSAPFATQAPSDRVAGVGSVNLLLVCMAALPLGLVLDRWFGLLPALTARCGAFETLRGTLEWHWAYMPATCLMMLFAAPAWIGLKAMTAGRSRGAGHERRIDALAALGCHFAMLVGMAYGLDAGPALASLARLQWTSGAAIAAMAFGMVGEMAAASLCAALNSAAPRRS
jgi:hypothetical protein